MSNKYKVIALMGKSGSGKDTILNEVCKTYPDIFHKKISSTTRPKRENEVDGVDYYFLDNHEFGEKIVNLEMVEACIFNDWAYGTEIRALDKSKINIGVFSPDGVRALLESGNIDVRVCYIDCSDKLRLLRALNREEEPNVEEIIRRFGTDKRDFEEIDFEYIIVPNDKQTKISAICELILLLSGRH